MVRKMFSQRLPCSLDVVGEVDQDELLVERAVKAQVVWDRRPRGGLKGQRPPPLLKSGPVSGKKPRGRGRFRRR